MNRLFLFILFLLPYFGFADDWTVLGTNKTEYPLGFILHETDIINIQIGEFLLIRNIEKKQVVYIIMPGEKTILQCIEEAKELEKERKKAAQNKYQFGEPSYLLFNYSDYLLPFWIQE